MVPGTQITIDSHRKKPNSNTIDLEHVHQLAMMFDLEDELVLNTRMGKISAKLEIYAEYLAQEWRELGNLVAIGTEDNEALLIRNPKLREENLEIVDFYASIYGVKIEEPARDDSAFATFYRR